MNFLSKCLIIWYQFEKIYIHILYVFQLTLKTIVLKIIQLTGSINICREICYNSIQVRTDLIYLFF